MGILSKHLPLVKEQEAFHKKMAERKPPNSFGANLHRATSDKFHALCIDIAQVEALLEAPQTAPSGTPTGGSKLGQLSLSMSDIADLPAELVEELNLSDGDKAEFAILAALEESGGVITLDRLLIALYRKTGEIHKRNALTNRLHRMSQKGRVFNAPGKKGVYTAEQLSAAEAAEMFGTIKPDGLSNESQAKASSS